MKGVEIRGGGSGKREIVRPRAHPKRKPRGVGRRESVLTGDRSKDSSTGRATPFLFSGVGEKASEGDRWGGVERRENEILTRRDI